MGDNLHEGHRNRVKKRFLRDGLQSFEPHQILEMLLFFGIPRKDTNVTAHQLIETFGGLSGVLKASYQDLAEVKGITPSSAMLISFCGQLIREYYTISPQDLVLDSTQKMGNYILPRFFGETNEKVLLVCLDSKCKVVYSSFISEGSMNAAEIHVRRILEQAIRSHAAGVVIAHNHPGGFALPSSDDVLSTQELIKSLSANHIHVIDHIIVADDDFVSMRSTPSLATMFG